MDIFSSLLRFADFVGNMPLSFASVAGTAMSDLTNCLINNGFASGCDALPNNFFSEIGSIFTNVSSFFSSGWASIINYLWYFLPDGGTFPTVIHTAAQSLGGAMSNLSFVLPVHDLVLVVFLIFSIKASLIVYYLTSKVIGLVRGFNVTNRIGL